MISVILNTKEHSKQELNNCLVHKFGGEHFYEGLKTPLVSYDSSISDNKEKEKINILFEEIINVMGLDSKHETFQGTPTRTTTTYIDEVFTELNPANKLKISLFDNAFQYNHMLVEKNITFYSTCEDHYGPLIGKAHVAYFSSGKVISLSKLNRVVQYFAKRPQAQERLTNQIAEELQVVLNTKNVAVSIDAQHLCVSARGIRDETPSTVTSYFGGKFNNQSKIVELQNTLKY